MIHAETLDLLDWPRLCQHLATFTATELGAIAARHLPIPTTQAASQTLLTQTKEAYALEDRLPQGIPFKGIHDFGDALERAERQGVLKGDELLKIATTLAGARQLRRLIADQEDTPSLETLVADLRTYPELEQAIHHCIDERGDVTDRASEKLVAVRGQLKGVRDRIQEKLQRIIQRQGGALQQAVITQRGDRFVLAVKAPQKDHIPGIVHDTSSTGSTLFIEPHSIVEWGNTLRQLQRQEEREIEIILRQLTEQVAEVLEDLETLLAIVTVLDLATARARYGLWLEANPPHFIDPTEPITLRHLRHPLLVWQAQREQGEAVIPINVQIRPDIRVVAITGPNTGGKTVTLKTIGLMALMAKVGMFIPAREPVELPWFDGVFADIGDEQSLEQSLSTFSGHIRRISRIFDQMTPQSLVLLDEVGAGTDPSEGSALATALLYHLADRVRLAIATTHYGELKALKYQDSRFENASVEFDEATLAPTYRLLWGIPGRSNALSIAQRLGLSEAIIAAARAQMGNDSEDVNQVIAGLEAQRRQQEEKAQEAEKLVAEAERFYREVSERAQLLQEREQDLKRSQEQAVTAAITEAKSEIAQVIRDLQQRPKKGQTAQKATAAINAIAQRHLPKAEPKRKPGYYPKVGEKIRIPRLGQTAEVLALEENEKAIVQFGLMKTTIPLSDIESLDGKTVEPPEPPKAKTPPAAKTPPPRAMVRSDRNTLDIRGHRVSQMESDVETGINHATDLGILWIIHGKGTGKLRQGVHDFLATHPQVERFELAPQNEGGSGVTVAYLL
ncbi:endonuclease MutS2 [Spirulina major CS-329]|uniref:endonuclease MutS2 n=1 Tax=Spirulina TaxID=1154 RepID=UPI00232E78A7|nr:endonuclease MutS2 [Spirulina subsalsa]MDB9502874.1 endonuclease MutS2 [Spirulina major CS-329]